MAEDKKPGRDRTRSGALFRQLDAQVKSRLEAAGDVTPDEVSEQLPDVPITRLQLNADWAPTSSNLDEVWELALSGCNEETIARVGLKVPDEVYFQLKEAYPVILETIISARRTGEAIAARSVLNALLDRGHKNRIQAAQFYLKHRAQWSEVLNANLPLVPPIDTVKQLTDNQLLKRLNASTRSALKQNETVINPTEDDLDD